MMMSQTMKLSAAVFAGLLFAATPALSADYETKEKSPLVDTHLRVPADVSLVGFDALAVGQYLVPKLTSVGVPWYRVALTALDVLIDMMSGPHAVRPVHRFEPELVLGESAVGTPSEAGSGGAQTSV